MLHQVPPWWCRVLLQLQVLLLLHALLWVLMSSQVGSPLVLHLALSLVQSLVLPWRLAPPSQLLLLMPPAVPAVCVVRRPRCYRWWDRPRTISKEYGRAAPASAKLRG